jgi:hypothetical protein
MPESPGNAPEHSGAARPSAGQTGRDPEMLVRISVPAEGGMREVAGEVATKIAEYLGSRDSDVASIVAAIDRLAAKVAPPGGVHNEITFEFHAANGELVVHAQCAGRTSEARHRLPT